jgi:hypothetical protein
MAEGGGGRSWADLDQEVERVVHAGNVARKDHGGGVELLDDRGPSITCPGLRLDRSKTSAGTGLSAAKKTGRRSRGVETLPVPRPAPPSGAAGARGRQSDVHHLHRIVGAGIAVVQLVDLGERAPEGGGIADAAAGTGTGSSKFCPT